MSQVIRQLNSGQWESHIFIGLEIAKAISELPDDFHQRKISDV